MERVDSDLRDAKVADGSVDVALTALNFHDIYNGRGEPAALDFLGGIHRMLKPGGVLGIIDHDGDPTQDNEKLHRIEKQRVLDVIAKSSFTLDAESDVLSNDTDEGDRADGYLITLPCLHQSELNVDRNRSRPSVSRTVDEPG